jgi:hypothetical protein
MTKEFEPVTNALLSIINEWEPKLAVLSEEVITERKNSQNRTIRQIAGHMIDSASNNNHRIVHLQYGKRPLIFPDYANLGNSDRWVMIQNYQEEDWKVIVQLWKYSNIHLAHVIENVDPDKLENFWINALDMNISLRKMIVDYLRHFKLHISEINEIMTRK